MFLTGATLSLVLSACGGGGRQDANEPSRSFDVQVPTASFPTAQTLSQHVQMVITVRNPDQKKTIPNVAVTITDANYGTSAQAFAERIASPSEQSTQGLASASRPVWIVDQAPDAGGGCGYSCSSGGAGGAVTAYSNTWALGPLKPGRTATFRWKVTPIKAGTHVVHWAVAAGLNGRARARLADGSIPHGTGTVTIRSKPQHAYFNNSGQIVISPYRAIVAPMINYIEVMHRQRPDLTLTVILPEIVVRHWWHRILHNQIARRLRRALRPVPNACYGNAARPDDGA